MRLIATDGVAWSVGLSVMTVSPAKTAEPVEMPFDVDSGGPKELRNRWGSRSPHGKGHF